MFFPQNRKSCNTRQYWRSPNYNWMRIQLAVVIAVIFGSSFIDAGEMSKMPSLLSLCSHCGPYIMPDEPKSTTNRDETRASALSRIEKDKGFRTHAQVWPTDRNRHHVGHCPTVISIMPGYLLFDIMLSPSPQIFACWACSPPPPPDTDRERASTNNAVTLRKTEILRVAQSRHPECRGR